jgi:hypothetical protein
VNNRMRRWGLAAAAFVVVGAPLAVVQGVSHADEQPWIKVNLHWNVNLTDVGNQTCPQTSEQIAEFSPGNSVGTQVDMQANRWTMGCGDVISRVTSRAKLLDGGNVEITTNLAALKDGVNYTNRDETFVVTPDGGVVAKDIKLDSSGEATAAGHFVASAHFIDGYEPTLATAEAQLSNGDVSGVADVQMWRTGQFRFVGHLHNDGFSTKNVKVNCVSMASDGKAFMFEAAGDTNGTLPALGNDKSFDWDANGTNTDLNSAFQDGTLSQDTPFNCVLSVETDTGADVAGGAVIIIKVVEAIFSIFGKGSN